MKTSHKKFDEIGTTVYVVQYWFDYDNGLVQIRVFRSLELALTFMANLEQIGFTKFTFFKSYWLGYFNDEGNFVYTDND